MSGAPAGRSPGPPAVQNPDVHLAYQARAKTVSSQLLAYDPLYDVSRLLPNKSASVSDALSGYQPRKSRLLQQAAAQTIAQAQQPRDQHQQSGRLRQLAAVAAHRRQFKHSVGRVNGNLPTLRAAVKAIKFQIVGEHAANQTGGGGQDGELCAHRRVVAAL